MFVNKYINSDQTMSMEMQFEDIDFYADVSSKMPEFTKKDTDQMESLHTRNEDDFIDMVLGIGIYNGT